MGDLTRLTASLELNSVQFRQEIDKDTKKMRELRAQAKRAGKDVSGFSNHMRNASRNVAVIQGPLGSIAGRLSSVASIASSGVTPAMVGVGAAVSATTFAVYEAVSAFSELERLNLRTEALLRSTGSAAGLTSDELNEMAMRVGDATLASANQVRKAQGIMLTFRTVQEESFTRSIELSQDLAEVMGTDITQAALQLGKALEEPTIGLTALRRSGVSFTEAEREMIKEMAETNRIAEAQIFILDKLEQQIGGAGEGAGGGVAGAADLLKENWTEMLETLGNAGPGEAAGSMLETIARGFQAITDQFAPDTFDTVYAEYESLQNRINELQQRSAANPRARAGINAQIAALQEQSDVLMEQLRVQADIEKEAEAERAAADQAAKDAALQRQEEFEAEQTRKAQEQGQKDLVELQKKLTSEREAIRLEYEQRLETIRKLQLSEEEIRRQGFENIEALRDEMAAREEERYLSEQAKINERELQEELRQEQQLARLEEKRKKAREKEQKEAEDAAKKKMELEQSVTDGAIGLIKGLTKEGSTARRVALVAEKAAALIRAKISMQEAIAKANAIDPTGALAAKARIEGMINIASIAAVGLAGVAHGGLDNVPTEGTYLLDRGERVLSPNQNEDLTKFLSNQQQMMAMPQIVINEAPGVTAQTEVTDGVLTIDMVREDLANGGEISELLQATHNVQRTPDR